MGLGSCRVAGGPRSRAAVAMCFLRSAVCHRHAELAGWSPPLGGGWREKGSLRVGAYGATEGWDRHHTRPQGLAAKSSPPSGTSALRCSTFPSPPAPRTSPAGYRSAQHCGGPGLGSKEGRWGCGEPSDGWSPLCRHQGLHTQSSAGP